LEIHLDQTVGIHDNNLDCKGLKKSKPLPPTPQPLIYILNYKHMMKAVTPLLRYSAEKRVPLQELSKWYPM